MATKPVAPVVRLFDTGANRDRVEGKLDFRGFISPKAARRFAAYMNKNRKLADGSLRQSDNWKLGIPIPVYIESMGRHWHELWEALEDGDWMLADEAACGLRFNVDGYLHERVKLMDADGTPYPGRRVPGNRPPLGYPEAQRLYDEMVAALAKKNVRKAA